MGRIILAICYVILARFLGLFFGVIGVIGVIGGVFVFILLVRVWLGSLFRYIWGDCY